MTTREFLTPLNTLLIALFAGATVAGFVLVPQGASLPVHWGITGEPDIFMPRDGALIVLPVIALAVFGLLSLILRVAGEKQRAASHHAFAALNPALLALFTAIQAGIVYIGTGGELDMVRLVVIGVGALFVALGNIFPKTQPNGLAGVRLPWTMRDPANWVATHRLAGLLSVIGGLGIVATAILTNAPLLLLAVTFIGTLGPLLIAGWYSWRLSKR